MLRLDDKHRQKIVGLLRVFFGDDIEVFAYVHPQGQWNTRKLRQGRGN
jgi:hypothetical protein